MAHPSTPPPSPSSPRRPTTANATRSRHPRRWIPPLICLAALHGSPPARAEVFVDDPLIGAPQSAPAVSSGRQGGRAGPGGWTITGPEDTTWYRIPAALPRGRVEVSVTGLSAETNLNGKLHDLVVLYGATDREEPVRYAPFFRSNDFKVQVRVIGTDEPSRGPGATKMELRRCPMGGPGHHEFCDPGCDETVESSYLRGAPLAALRWDPDRTYRLVVEWGPGWMTYARDDDSVRVEYPGAFAPEHLVVRLGSPRHAMGDGNRLPDGMTFADLRVTGERGEPTVACGAPPFGDGDEDGDSADDCVQAIALDPSDARGTQATLRATYQHCQGAEAFRIAQIWVGDRVGPGEPRVSAGLERGVIGAYGETCMPGEPTLLRNEWGGVDCERTRAAVVEDRWVVDWGLFFDPDVFGGAHQVFYDAKGGDGAPEPRLGWTRMGEFTVDDAPAAAAPDDEPHGEAGSGDDTDSGADEADSGDDEDEPPEPAPAAPDSEDAPPRTSTPSRGPTEATTRPRPSRPPKTLRSGATPPLGSTPPTRRRTPTAAKRPGAAIREAATPRAPCPG